MFTAYSFESVLEFFIEFPVAQSNFIRNYFKLKYNRINLGISDCVLEWDRDIMENAAMCVPSSFH